MACYRLAGLARLGNEEGEVGQGAEHGIAGVLLRGIAVDREELVGGQASVPLRVSVQSLPDFFRRDLDVFVFIGQPFGLLVDGCCHWGCVAVLGVGVVRGREWWAGGADRTG